MKAIVGYTDRISAAPGDTVRFMVSSERETPYRADIVRLISGDLHPEGAGFKEAAVGTAVDGDYPGRRQAIHAGSFVHVPAGPAFDLASFTLQAFVWPSMPGSARQVVLGRWSAAEDAGFALVIDGGAAGLLIGDGRGGVECLTTGRPLLARHWYFLAATYDEATGTAGLRQEPLARYPGVEDEAAVEAACGVTPAPAPPAPVTMAAAWAAAWAASSAEDAGGRPAGRFLYNGKIARPRICEGAIDGARMTQLQAARLPDSLAAGVVAAWDFSRDMSAERIVDVGPRGLDGRAVHLPARAMTGPGWTGEEPCWRHAPEQYDAIHFHEDDVYDAGWQPDFALTVPETLRSGVYAARLRTEGGDDHVPFFVRPPRGRTTADLALLIPTASYMAYANEHGCFDTPVELLSGVVPALKPEDLFVNEHREYGLSFYDTHADGSGVCYSSRLRPILNMRPGYTIAWVGPGGSAPWQFNADLHIVDWLEARGHGYDVVTDEDLHADGAGLLEPYRAVMTATHPEYYSTAMWDGVHGYLAGGGRLIYMGGNGFYWRVAYNDALPGAIELRRTEDGIRDWEAEPGEYYHSFTGEYGGLWRRLGRPPQILVGVGMAGQGFDVCGHFRRRPGPLDPRLAFVFEGVEEDVIGDFGVVGGGAAGLELDRHDARLGSPPNAVILASSENLTNLYYPGPEDVNSLMPHLGADDSGSVRGDMVFMETPNDGAVFSMSSISWAGSLCHNGYDNNVSRVTDNVLRRFLDPAPFGRGRP